MSRDKELEQYEEEAKIMPPTCIINGCNQKLSAMLDSEDPLTRNRCKTTTVCNNGLGYRHVVTGSGKHYGIHEKSKTELL